MDYLEIREKAILTIREDRVPTDVLAELVKDFGEPERHDYATCGGCNGHHRHGRD